MSVTPSFPFSPFGAAQQPTPPIAVAVPELADADTKMKIIDGAVQLAAVDKLAEAAVALAGVDAKAERYVSSRIDRNARQLATVSRALDLSAINIVSEGFVQASPMGIQFPSEIVVPPMPIGTPPIVVSSPITIPGLPLPGSAGVYYDRATDNFIVVAPGLADTPVHLEPATAALFESLLDAAGVLSQFVQIIPPSASRPPTGGPGFNVIPGEPIIIEGEPIAIIPAQDFGETPGATIPVPPPPEPPPPPPPAEPPETQPPVPIEPLPTPPTPEIVTPPETELVACATTEPYDSGKPCSAYQSTGSSGRTTWWGEPAPPYAPWEKPYWDEGVGLPKASTGGYVPNRGCVYDGTPMCQLISFTDKYDKGDGGPGRTDDPCAASGQAEFVPIRNPQGRIAKHPWCCKYWQSFRIPKRCNPPHGNPYWWHEAKGVAFWPAGGIVSKYPANPDPKHPNDIFKPPYYAFHYGCPDTQYFAGYNFEEVANWALHAPRDAGYGIYGAANDWLTLCRAVARNCGMVSYTEPAAPPPAPPPPPPPGT